MWDQNGQRPRQTFVYTLPLIRNERCQPQQQSDSGESLKVTRCRWLRHLLRAEIGRTRKIDKLPRLALVARSSLGIFWEGASNVISCGWVKAGGLVNCLDILLLLLIFSDNVTLCHVHQDLLVTVTCPHGHHRIATSTDIGKQEHKAGGSLYFVKRSYRCLCHICLPLLATFKWLTTNGYQILTACEIPAARQ